MHPTQDRMRIELDRRHAFYLDTVGNIHPICAYRLHRLHRGEPDASLPQMAGQRVRFAVFHVERFTQPPRVVVDFYPALPLDADGRVDRPLYYYVLQAEVDHLEANDYAISDSSTSSLSRPDLSTTWTPDPITHYRLITALCDLCRRPPWLPRQPRLMRPAA